MFQVTVLVFAFMHTRLEYSVVRLPVDVVDTNTVLTSKKHLKTYLYYCTYLNPSAKRLWIGGIYGAIQIFFDLIWFFLQWLQSAILSYLITAKCSGAPYFQPASFRPYHRHAHLFMLVACPKTHPVQDSVLTYKVLHGSALRYLGMPSCIANVPSWQALYSASSYHRSGRSICPAFNHRWLELCHCSSVDLEQSSRKYHQCSILLVLQAAMENICFYLLFFC